MKKIIITLALLIFCSCSDDTVNIMIPGSSESLEKDTKLIELTFEGNTHQFIFNHSYVGHGVYDVEMIHWPSCKYCLENLN